jgi:hypothetical protein
MAVYFWIGDEPDHVYVVNHKRIRVEHRATYETQKERAFKPKEGAWKQLGERGC